MKTLKQSVRAPRLAVLLAVLTAIAVLGLLIWPHLRSDGADPKAATSSSRADQAFAVEALAGRYEQTAPMAFTNSLMRTMPTRLYRVNGEPPAPLLDGLMVGKITKVAPGRAFVDSDTKVEEVDFDNDRATRRTVLVSSEVEMGWGGLVAGRDDVRFAVVLDGKDDPARVMSGIRQFGRIVVGLERAKLASDPELPVVSNGGGFFGIVSKDGAITLPVMAAQGAAFLGAATTVDLLEAELTKPRATVALKLTAQGYELSKRSAQGGSGASGG